MQVKHNVLTNLELNHMISELGNLGKDYPIYEKNVHKKLPDDWKWADSICKLNVPNVKISFSDREHVKKHDLYAHGNR